MLNSIHLCRGIAALLVVLFHAAVNLSKDKYFGTVADPIESIFWFGGGAGVAFFFVLSGFIIHHVHERDMNHPQRLLAYLRKRAVRIYPTYWIIFMVVYLLAMLSPSLREGLPLDAAVLLKSLLLIPQDSQKVGGTGAPVLIVAWSLQYELCFYAAFATALIKKWLLYCIALAFTVSFLLQPLGLSQDFPGSFFASHLIVLFGIGMAASKVVKARPRLSSPGVLAALATGVFCMVALAANLSRGNYSKPVFDLAYGLVSALLIVALASHDTQRKENPLPGRLSFLGDASYALYLIHFPLIAILSKISIAVLPRNLYGASLAFLLLVGGSVLVAALFHRWIERPVLRYLAPARPLQQAALAHGLRPLQGEPVSRR
jgi:exopolysaccharide production protein ExoZ